MTARENIYLNGAVLGHDKQFMETHFDEIVDFAELKDFLDMPIKNFSSGMAARLGFSIATVVKPDILICDEVLAVGDYAFQRKCERRMSDMRRRNHLAVCFSFYGVGKKICDHALWLDKGIVKASGEIRTVARAYLNSLSGVPDVKENINRIEELSDDSCKSLSIFCSPEARRKGRGWFVTQALNY